MGKIDLSPKLLKELYWDRKMSSPEIADLHNCRPELVRYLLRKYNIRIRTKSEAQRLLFNIDIPKKDLERLYLKEKLSSPKIAKKFKCSPGLIRKRLRQYGIPIRNTVEAVRLANVPKYPQ